MSASTESTVCCRHAVRQFRGGATQAVRTSMNKYEITATDVLDQFRDWCLDRLAPLRPPSDACVAFSSWLAGAWPLSDKPERLLLLDVCAILHRTATVDGPRPGAIRPVSNRLFMLKADQ